MSSLLSDIVRHKRTEIAAARRRTPEKQLWQRAESAPPVRDFHNALSGSRPGLIAEVKKASPSAGIIRADFDPVDIARTYEAAGARCLSVLTDEKFFQGHLKFLQQIRSQVSLPVMRKEFILDRYQVLEARASGADCVLLIAECLSQDELNDLHRFAGELGMQTLIELYDATNLQSVLNTGTRLVGINNRDLRTFATSLDHTFDLMDQIPPEVLLVSESGIRTHGDVLRLAAAGVGGILVGESLMRQPDIGSAVRQLMEGPSAQLDAS
ncbi:MAG: indole-3-glycerol phosphate synthase TrpC [Fuerstiella sp.]|nr:indole-3-glycerol phosphate synthase TrpC [Fuerstiella sp.]